MNNIILHLNRKIYTPLREGEFGKVIHWGKLKLKRKLGRELPWRIVICTATVCNLRCPFCTAPPWEVPRNNRILGFEDFKKIFNQVKDMAYHYTLHGAGEPLMNKELFDMARYVSDNNCSSIISTNATLLDAERIEKLLTCGIDEVTLAFDGGTKESYEKMRVGANFEAVLDNIKNLCQRRKELKLRKPFLWVQFIVTRFNQHEVEEAKRMFLDMGIDHFHTERLNVNLHLPGRNAMDPKILDFLPDGVPIPYEIRDKRAYLKKTHYHQQCLHPYSPIINEDGDVTICCYDPFFRAEVGNVFETPFKEMWYSEEYMNIRQLGRNRKLDICKDCPA